MLVLWPERSDSRVRCQIMHCSLQDPKFPYTAISYAWGDVGDKKTISISDVYTEKDEEVEISITASLETALKALRRVNQPTYVWADALSIDQRNSAEKKEQVRRMTQIYQKADSVAICLGMEANNSELAMDLIHEVGRGVELPERITEDTRAPFTTRHLAATAALFDRDYWHRLWVVQEVFNAKRITVFCGPSKLPWQDFEETSLVFRHNETLLHQNFPVGARNEHYHAPKSHLSVPQALIYQGPSSILELGSPGRFRELENKSDAQLFAHLLTVMRLCRRKLSSEPRDKVFGVLGVLPPTICDEIQVDYDISVKDVYVNIVDILLRTTRSLDVICEAIHYPPHASNVSIPSWVPDWSHVPDSKPIGLDQEHGFSASGTTKCRARTTMDSDSKNKLEISAIYLGTVKHHGTALGTLCTLSDYLMAFLNWRSLLVDSFASMGMEAMVRAEEDFCLTLCFHQVPSDFESAGSWLDICYHVFSAAIQKRLPSLTIDEYFKSFAYKSFGMSQDDRRQLIQDHIASRMMGRRFIITHEKQMGLGTGFMMPGDVIVVPLGCSTPIVLRPEDNEYRFVGDVYINGYMRGRAVQENEEGMKGREVRQYVLH